MTLCCRLRARVASGLTSQPPAADMRELEWDEELARAAQAHAEQCKFRHDCPDCRRVKRFKAGVAPPIAVMPPGPAVNHSIKHDTTCVTICATDSLAVQVGQNLYQSFTTKRNQPPNWRKAVDSWYNEISLFPQSSVGRYSFSHKAGNKPAPKPRNQLKYQTFNILQKVKDRNVIINLYGQSVWCERPVGCGVLSSLCRLATTASWSGQRPPASAAAPSSTRRGGSTRGCTSATTE